ncbi:YitT family protein [Oryzomicrobium sp.]|uniref:YitT family protein n=1 Tax=Oryzomicrobium sp. TaxID=1911578 RepID=UPI0025D259EF|nr:YitT family protein [Oryzomicrobium sp.]MCE1243164.1 YitT family protein [Oryzomicrobium sp.]
MTASIPPVRHSLAEDIQALLVGPLFVALSVVFFRHAGLLTGGTAGLAFLAHYASDWSFGVLFFVINLPFYFFAVRTLGWVFTVKTFAAVALLSLYSELLPHLIHFDRLDPLFAGIMGGFLTGIGLLILVRHKASLGGLGVLAIYLQETRGWRAGKVQMAADLAIVGAALLIRPVGLVGISVIGAMALNLVIAVNHKPGRYVGM